MASCFQARRLCTVPPLNKDVVDRLIGRNDFYGITSRTEKSDKQPEATLFRFQESFRRNYRIRGDNLYISVVQRLQEDNRELLRTLQLAPERWIPMLVRLCGNPLSNLNCESRNFILDCLWEQILRHDLPICLKTFNNRLLVSLENEREFNAVAELEEMRQQRQLDPDQTTFHHVLERIARLGDVEGCRKMVYTMANHGCIVDGVCNASLVYCFAVRGHYAKADSLIEQSSTKYGDEAFRAALGASARAAARRGDSNRLRQVLRTAVDDNKQLTISPETVFETIWLLTKQSRPRDNNQLYEQMLDRIPRPTGFFRLLIREIERHIAHEHYYTAITLLEDTNKISDILKNQDRILFLKQLLGRLCSQLIRNEVPLKTVEDIANRVTTIFTNKSIRFYDDLLFSSLMYKKFNMDDKMRYLTAFADIVDRRRERSHVILPMLAFAPSLEERLKIIFRCRNIGYDNLASLDINVIAKIILQPLFDSCRVQCGTRLDKVMRVLRSFGVSDVTIWKTLHAWWKLKLNAEKISESQDNFVKPYSWELQGWLKFHYAPIFNEESALNPSPNVANSSFERLKSIVEAQDSTKVVNFLNTHGWPENTDYEAIIPPILELVTRNEEWSTIKAVLKSMAGESGNWNCSGSESSMKYPVQNVHLLRVLRRMAQENSELKLREMSDYAFELRRLFPGATASYDNFFETLVEYKRLFGKCFERMLNPSVANIDDCIDFLRNLVKLDILTLHASETLTPIFINHVLNRVGWDEAVNTWMKFQSGLACTNGVVSLLRFCLFNKDKDLMKRNIQYVLHKAQNFASASRVHSLYAAVLASVRRYEEAQEYLEANSASINATDCVSSMRLINAFRYQNVDEDFILKFSELCLQYTNLSKEPEAAQTMQADSLRLCNTRNLGPLALRLYSLFKSYNLTLDVTERDKLWKMVEKHQDLSRRLMLAPEGLLQVTEDSDIIKNSVFYQLQNELRSDCSR